MGDEHRAMCVCRTRTVLVELAVRTVMTVPEDWSAADVEFKVNESSWCVDNAFSEIDDLLGDDGCMCSRTEGRFVREATEDDERHYGFTDDGEVVRHPAAVPPAGFEMHLRAASEADVPWMAALLEAMSRGGSVEVTPTGGGPVRYTFPEKDVRATPGWEQCGECNGTGKTERMHGFEMVCPVCGGSGYQPPFPNIAP